MTAIAATRTYILSGWKETSDEFSGSVKTSLDPEWRSPVGYSFALGHCSAEGNLHQKART